MSVNLGTTANWWRENDAENIQIGLVQICLCPHALPSILGDTTTPLAIPVPDSEMGLDCLRRSLGTQAVYQILEIASAS